MVQVNKGCVGLMAKRMHRGVDSPLAKIAASSNRVVRDVA